MKAGFAREPITPKLGTAMQGYALRDAKRGVEAIHDGLFARALYLEQAGSALLIVGLDLLALDRPTVDLYNAAIRDAIGLDADRVLLNTSHTHNGPCSCGWYYAEPDPVYLDRVEAAIVKAATAARDGAREATAWAGETHSELPLNRRKKDAQDRLIFAPNPDGPVCDTLPLCLIKDVDDEPVALLFSVSCPPSTVSGFAVSADFAGVAMERLDRHLGAPVSLFLQGAGGDAKPSVLGQGGEWHTGDWNDVRRAGLMVAREAMGSLAMGLFRVHPRFRVGLIDMPWPLIPPPGEGEYRALLEHPASQGDDPESVCRHRWAEHQLARLDADGTLRSGLDIRLHGVQLGNRVRLVGLEGDAVSELGLLVRDAYREGVTFALGCTNGCRMVLPTSAMLYEGGTEVLSYFEYRQPSPLAKGMEHIFTEGIEELRRSGVGEL